MLANMWRKGNACALLVGMQAGIATKENYRDFLRKLKLELLYDSIIPLLGVH